MKVIAGKHKGRKINIIVDKTIRPTRPMVREAIFSILSSGEFVDIQGNDIIEGATMLDIFSGSGSFSMEALSRGASSVLLIDKDRKHLNLAKENIESINELEKAQFICADIERLYPPAGGPVDLVFIDPPYAKNMVEKSIQTLKSNNWLKAGTVIVVETAYKDKIEQPEYLDLVISREYGHTKISIYLVN